LQHTGEQARTRALASPRNAREHAERGGSAQKEPKAREMAQALVLQDAANCTRPARVEEEAVREARRRGRAQHGAHVCRACPRQQRQLTPDRHPAAYGNEFVNAFEGWVNEDLL